MSAPPPTAPTPPLEAPLEPKEERELLAELGKREKAEVKRAHEAARALAPGAACPVCKGGLEAARSMLPGFILERPAIGCPKCGLVTPSVPSLPFEVASWVVVFLLARAALRWILEAQQLTQNGPRLWAFAAGGTLAGLAMSLYSTVRNRRSGHAAAELILARTREREEEAAGIPKRPAWLVTFRQQADLLREVVFCAVLFLLLRHVAVEAYVIPTGSMAPTLLGNNFRAQCDRCGNDFPVNKLEGGRPLDGSPVSVRCPLCLKGFGATPTETIDGNKILVDKLVYRLRPPRRWEVVVFHFPKEPHTVYIKRLVGLPGDVLEIRNGDIYASGELQRKPDHVQDAIWIPVLDTRLPYPGAKSSWTVEAGTAARDWDVQAEGAHIVATPTGAESWLRCVREVTNHNGYNRPGTSDDGSHAVGDMRITTEVTPAAGATVLLATLEHDARRVIGSFPTGEGTGEYRISVEEHGVTTVLAAEPAGRGLTAGKRTTIALAYADDRARLLVDGKVVCAAIDATAPTAPPPVAMAELGAKGGQVLFDDTRLDRDLYYVHLGNYPYEYRLDTPLTVPDNCFVCLGDNSTSSLDGRYWGFVRKEALLGRAFFVWWPVRPFQLGRVR